jgi:periplasmic protein TonB
MFAESMLETSWAHRTQRSWTTLTSFGLQAVLLGALLSVPLLRTVGLPLARTVSVPVSFGHTEPQPTRTFPNAASSAVPIVPLHGRLMTPTRIPTTIPDDGGTSPELPIGGERNGIGAIGLTGDLPTGFPLSTGGTRPVMPVPPSTLRKFRTSTMLQGSLIRRVEPLYPPLARAARIQGPVVLAAIISTAGTIEHLQVLSGHPMLVNAALQAVGQWRYRPYVLNGEVIEVETQITVNFKLN